MSFFSIYIFYKAPNMNTSSSFTKKKLQKINGWGYQRYGGVHTRARMLENQNLELHPTLVALRRPINIVDI